MASYNVIVYDPDDTIVANRVIEYVNTPNYSIFDYKLVDPDVSELSEDPRYWKVSGETVVEMSSEEKDSIDIQETKDKKIAEILANTEIGLSKGVPHNGYRFSVTPSAKSNWLAIVMGKDMLSYPYSVPTGFNSIYNFVSADDVIAFFTAGMSFVQYWEQSNEQLRIAINNCSTCAEVSAIIDDRSYNTGTTTTSSTSTSTSTTTIE